MARTAPAPPTQTGGTNNSITASWVAPSTIASDDSWNLYVNGTLVSTVASTVLSATYTNVGLTNGTSVNVKLNYGKVGDISDFSADVPMIPGPLTTVIRRPSKDF